MRAKSRVRGKVKQVQSVSDRRMLQVFQDMEEILVHLLLCNVCPACGGLGRLPAGTDPEGKMKPLILCACRRLALSLLADYDLAEDPDPVSPGEDPDEDEDEDGGFPRGQLDRGRRDQE